jgi:hypothetical protein
LENFVELFALFLYGLFFFLPTMVLALSFRVVMQATPPFLVVHTNAAYTRLTGIDSHAVVGKTVGSILSVPVEEAVDEGLPEEAAPSSVAPDLERLVTAGGFGNVQHLHVVAAKVAPPSSETDEQHRNGVAVQDEEHHSTSLTSSSEAKTNILSCRASIAPIVSAFEAAAVDVRDSDLEHNSNKSKRQKHHDSNQETDSARKVAGIVIKDPSTARPAPRHQSRQLVTHYVIQLAAAPDAATNHDNADDPFLLYSKSLLHQQQTTAKS